MKEDGGRAFPNPLCPAEHPGMTLRDWFAGQALAGIYAGDKDNSVDYPTAAKWSYETADAMIAERNKE